MSFPALNNHCARKSSPASRRNWCSPFEYEHQLEIAAKFLEKEISFLTGRGCTSGAESVLSFVVRKRIPIQAGSAPHADAAEKLVGDAVAMACC